MPVPIIAGAAAIAARLAAKKVAQAAAKKVLPNTIRVSAANRKRIAARKAAANPKKASRPATKIGNEPVSKNNTRKLMEPKSAVNVKPAAKPIPNKIDAAKIKYQRESSRARDRKKLPQDHPDRDIKLGKDQTKRVSSKVSGSGPDGFGRSPIKPSLSKTDPWRIDIPNKNAVKINSAKPTTGRSNNFVEVPVKDSKYGERPGVFVSRAVAARKPTRKPTRNLENPPKGTVVIRSSSPSYLRKKAVPMKTPVVKKTPRKFALPKKK